MKNRLVIIGASGHGKVIADIALKQGYQDIVFLDDNGAIDSCMEFEVVGKTAEAVRLHDGKTDFIIAVGNNQIRKRIATSYDVNWVSLVHPTAIIGINAEIGRGTVVMAGAIINADAHIGEHCIINSGSIVEHDNLLEDYVHISPKATLAGTVHVGEATHVGIGAVVRNNINICDNCIIGAGAVVVKDIKEQGTYVGVPGRKR